MRIKDLLSILWFYQTNDQLDTSIYIESIEIDSRKVKKNSMFICIPGFKVDGHDFAQQAINQGATVIISEKRIAIDNVLVVYVPSTIRALALLAAKFYQFPTLDMFLVGITGTNGKTTTTYILEKIFQEYGLKTGVIGTIQGKVDQKVFEVNNTTPDALALQRILREMREMQVDVTVMEVSSHALQLGRVDGCDFNVALFTNLSQDHLDFHQNMQQYAEVKSLLFSGLGNAYKNDQKFAIVNIDDAYSKTMLKKTNQTVITYGMDVHAHIHARNINYHLQYTSFDLVTPVGELKITSKLIGSFNVYNMLAATAVAMTHHIDLSIIKLALEKVKAIPGRFEQIDKGQNFAVIIDYAHTPIALESVLKTVKTFATKKIYVVIGAGGDRDQLKRSQIGKVAVTYSDFSIFTMDNPRNENPNSIISDITDDLSSHDNYQIVLDRKKAIHTAINYATKEDIVIIAGKGHEIYQEIQGVKHSFSDVKVAEEAILKKGL